jgi:thiosulfate reductase cytochrome b subunit
VVFFVGHLGLVIHAGWNNFRAMVSGYELKSEAPHERAP